MGLGFFSHDFTSETSSTLSMVTIETNNGSCSFAIDLQRVAENKQKWNFFIVGQVMENNASFLKRALWKWSFKSLLEVQRVEEDLFLLRFQSNDIKQSILQLSHMSFGNRVLFLRYWTPNERLKLDMVFVWMKFPNLRVHYFNAYVLSGLSTPFGKQCSWINTSSLNLEWLLRGYVLKLKRVNLFLNQSTLLMNYRTGLRWLFLSRCKDIASSARLSGTP